MKETKGMCIICGVREAVCLCKICKEQERLDKMKRRNQIKNETTICFTCGKTFRTLGQKNRTFCSVDCFKKGCSAQRRNKR